MVARADHSADSVKPCNKTTNDFGAQQALTVSVVIYSFEEGELGWIWRIRWIERIAQILNSDMAMSNDLTIVAQILRCAVVGDGWIGKGACIKTLRLNSDGEGCIGCDCLSDLRFNDHSRDHVRH